MEMTVFSYAHGRQPEDENLWDQKSWSHLCEMTATGAHDDANNYLYSILVVSLVQCLSNVPNEWRIAKFTGQSKYLTGHADSY